MMLFLKQFLVLVIFPLICSRLQVNLDRISENNVVLQHDCIHVPARRFSEIDPQQIISYCLSESSSKWKIEKNSLDKNFTFLQLMESGVTPEQLYHWSAPMSTIENYQFYLNKVSSSKRIPSMSSDWFYNCTSFNFGSRCEYSFDGYESSSLSLHEIIADYYSYIYRPTSWTCYTHPNCTVNSNSICLDWRNICDRQIDCPITGIDEQFCSQLRLDRCEDDEYKCTDGYCLPKSFLLENDFAIDCNDRQNLARKQLYLSHRLGREPTSIAEDTVCLKNHWLHNPFQSICALDRQDDRLSSMFLEQSNIVSDDCSFTFRCHFNIPHRNDPKCVGICANESCENILARSCPDLFFIPDVPIFFGHIRFAYAKENAIQSITLQLPPSYICYDHRLCGGFLPNKTLLFFENSTCRKPKDFPVKFYPGGRGDWLYTYVNPLYDQLYQCNTGPQDFLVICNRSTMYRCLHSLKCISNNRVGDRQNDCDYHDDEDQAIINQVCVYDRSEAFFNCSDKCINRKQFEDGFCDCHRNEYGICLDESSHIYSMTTQISFPNICDGFTELIPMNINGQDQTDETECQHWQCNNIYTRCDGFWNCLNGEDEVNCQSSSLFNCPLGHRCIAPNMTELMCLSLDKFNDGVNDCLESLDESNRCQLEDFPQRKLNFYCEGNSVEYCTKSRYYCNEIDQCLDENFDSWFCLPDRNLTIAPARCDLPDEDIDSNMEKYLCHHPFKQVKQLKTRYFSLQTDHQPVDTIDPEEAIRPLIPGLRQRCHRGLPLRVWLNKAKNLTDLTCLCPPSFYGNTCQYQNERVRITLKLLAYSASRRTLFNVLLMLIDDSPQRTVHFYEQFSYLYVRDCTMKFHVYLLFSTRPKDPTKRYFVRIDIHEKDSLIHRASVLIPLKFLFLPIQRIAYHLHIPFVNQNDVRCSHFPCVHGQCLKYFPHSKNLTFCHCQPGWSGEYCHLPYTCNCSSNSLCAGQSLNNRSICICPRNQFGSRCLISNPICQSNIQQEQCLNGGECVPMNEHLVMEKKFFCICPKGFRGDRCEISNTKILLSFQPNITLPLSMMVHFIQVLPNASPNNGSIVATVSINSRSSIIYWPHPFHISFLKLFDDDYYLILVQTTTNTSALISRTISRSDRCANFSEVLSENITRLHPLRRIKYYHLPCQTSRENLSCFYDHSHFCLCTTFGQQRLANCFEFHFRTKFDCFGHGNCVNGGECLQDRLTCPSMSVCMCPKCFYGKQCQFSTDGFGLSLDGILGYHIQPHVQITRQPIIVQMSLGFTIIMAIAGLIDGILSIITFNSVDLQKVGCSMYLLGSSIMTLLLTMVFLLKFLILIIAQINSLSNRTFLKLQCVSLDYLLRVCLNMDQWLNACVAIERAVTSVKGASFNQQKSKQMAKYVFIGLFFFVIFSNSYDPFNRDLIDDDDDEEQRIWCFVSYSSNFVILHSLNNIIHFFAPFVINIISAIVIIFVTARQRQSVHREKTYRSSLLNQIKQHKQLLIAPFVLTLLALPRLIISFVSGCMKSTDHAWLFLIGYFISFLPSMLTFIVFVLPSKLYRKEFSSKIRKYRSNIRTRLGMS